ncbi:hypothetical protein ACQP2F_13625 [Actinoplanes sp. CA-030573]
MLLRELRAWPSPLLARLCLHVVTANQMGEQFSEDLDEMDF